MRPISLIGLIGPIDGLHSRFSLLEVAGLREAHASGGVGDRVGVTGCGMDSSTAGHLSGEEAISTGPERLTCGQSELVRDRRRRDGVALEYLPANGVVLAVEADAGSALDGDRNRKRRDGRGAVQTKGLFAKPRAARVDHRRYGDPARAASPSGHGKSNGRGFGQSASGPGDGNG
jgi:hypothetical protein